MSEIIRWRYNKRTKTSFPIYSRKPPKLNKKGSTKSSGLLTSEFKRRLRLFNQKTRPLEKKHWEEGWHSSSHKIGNYSLCATKKDGLLDYYIQVKHGKKEFLSIPLKPLIHRTIDYGLSFSGVPIDSELLEKTILQILSDNKPIHHILLEQVTDELQKKSIELLKKRFYS